MQNFEQIIASIALLRKDSLTNPYYTDALVKSEAEKCGIPEWRMRRLADLGNGLKYPGFDADRHIEKAFELSGLSAAKFKKVSESVFINTDKHPIARPSHITQPHWDEWIASGVNPEIVAANVRSVDGELALQIICEEVSEKIQNVKSYPTEPLKRILNQNQNLVDGDGGWWLTGLDPLNNWSRREDWGQLKPNQPRPDTQKPDKLVKYVNPNQVDTGAIFLEDPTKPDRWVKVKNAPSIPLILVEGGKKAGALVSLGYNAIAIPGIWGAYRRKDDVKNLPARLIPEIEAMASEGRPIVFCYDQDEKETTRDAVRAAIRSTGNLLRAKGCKVGVAKWDKRSGKGIDDVLSQKGAAFVRKIIEKGIETAMADVSASKVSGVTEFKGKIAEDLEPDENDQKLVADYKRIKRLMGDRLRYNELRGIVELDGEKLDVDSARADLMIDYGLFIASGAEDVSGLVVKIAKQNSYHPVAEYLNKVYEQHGEKEGSLEILRCIADRYFGQSDPIYTIFVIRFLIAACARVLQPGCKHDSALILQGKQGVRKSSFFKALAGGDWFDDSLGNVGDKDEKLKLHQTWFMEWAELETVFKRKDVSQTKSFLSSANDKVRPPYARSVVDMPRRSVIVGTTNQDEFLNDSTGNRRFWIIPVHPSIKQIDTSTLIEERDRIWAAAMQLYKGGVHWHLWGVEELAADEIAHDYQSEDAWASYIREYLVMAQHVTVSGILENCVELEKSKHDKAAQMRVADTLRSMGWVCKKKRIDGVPTRVWEKPDEAVPTPVSACSNPSGEVATAETLEKSSLFQLCITVPTSKKDLVNKEEESEPTTPQLQENSDPSRENSLNGCHGWNGSSTARVSSVPTYSKGLEQGLEHTPIAPSNSNGHHQKDEPIDFKKMSEEEIKEFLATAEPF
jgi:predicted P-loop ATPase